jgi:hypothetical protein
MEDRFSHNHKDFFCQHVQNHETSGSTHSEALSEAREFVNTGDRANTQDLTHKQSDNQLNYKQLFKKKGRMLMATLRYSAIDDDNSGTLYSINQFFKNGTLDSTATTDQYKKEQETRRLMEERSRTTNRSVANGI